MEEDQAMPEQSFTDSDAKDLLYTPSSTWFDEEERHPWSCGTDSNGLRYQFSRLTSQLQSSVLMRCYDKSTGSIPDHQGRMLARAPLKRLDTYDVRRAVLRKHADPRQREATPFISMTNSPEALEEVAERKRAERRHDGKEYEEQFVIVIDPRVRLRKGRPILNFGDEMQAYDVLAPYETEYWRNQYLCLWEVGPEEVLGCYRWGDLRDQRDWYYKIMSELLNRPYAQGIELSSRMDSDSGSC